ncbi:MAG: FkbM family methyltransferase [Eubacteriales bacterium]
MGNIMQQINEVYSFLEDDLSRRVFETRLEYNFSRKTHNFGHLMKEENRSFYYLTDKNIYTTPLASGETIIFYGFTGMAVWDYNKIKARDPQCNFIFCDRRHDELKDHQFLIDNNLRMISPEELLGNYRDCKVIISISSKTRFEVFDFLKANGVQQILSGRLTDAMQYFEDFVPVEENEIFVDAGVRDGGTSLQFANWCDNHYEKIYLFEADRTVKNVIEKNITCLHNTELYMKGLWNTEATLSFQLVEKTGGSHIAENGTETMEAVALDDVLQGQRITFLKMDIEGSELKALEGAQESIKKHKPKLAISLYHKPEDILTLPLYIKQLVPEYKIILRHYSNVMTETVLYAFLK